MAGHARLTATRKRFLEFGTSRFCQESPQGSARRACHARSPAEIAENLADGCVSAAASLNQQQCLSCRREFSAISFGSRLNDLTVLSLPRRLLCTVALLVLAGIPAVARAQDDQEVEDVPAVDVQQQFMVADENFDQWVFGGRGNAAAIRKRFDSQLVLHVDELERMCGLSEAQKKKLHLAGQGDIKRLFDQVEVLRKKFQLVKNDQNKFNEFWQDVQPFQVTFSNGAFGPGSFFEKTLKNTLSSDQAASFQAADRERRMFQYRSTVEAVIGMLDQVVSFRAEQRHKFVELLVERKKLPRAFGQYNYYLVLYQLSQLPDDKLKEFLDEPQLKALRKVFNQVRGYEVFLKSNGYLPEVQL